MRNNSSPIHWTEAEKSTAMQGGILEAVKKNGEKMDGMKEIKVEIKGAEVVTLQGKPGEPGEKPTDEELKRLILPLIPDPVPTRQEIQSMIAPLIPRVKDGETPSDGKLLSLILPLIPEPIPGEPGSPDTPDEVVSKVNQAELKIDKDKVDGLKDIYTRFETLSNFPRGGGGGGSALTFQNNGTRLSSAITTVNFGSGLTALYAGGVVTVTSALGADDNYVTDAEKVVIAATSGTNTGDNAANSSTMYIGTTSHAINRASASETLSGITGLTPGANFVLTQNSVAVITSEETGALVDTLHLKAGNLGMGGVTNPGAYLDIGANTNTGSFPRLRIIGYSDTNPLAEFGDGSGTVYFRIFRSAANYIQVTNSGDFTHTPSGGHFGISKISPLSKLHIAAGSAAANTAPLQFDSGALESTPRAGVVEFFTDSLYFTRTTGAVRGMIGNTFTGRTVGATAAVASVLTYTIPAVDGSYEVKANVKITTATIHAINVTCAYTDESNTARTMTLNFSTVAGVISATAIGNAGGAVPYAGVPVVIRCKASTAITFATTGTFTTVTYNVEAFISQLS